MTRCVKVWHLAVAAIGAALASSSAAAQHGWLLPASISEQGDRIDHLFWLIFGITGVVFFLTEGLLLLFIVKYRAREGGKAYYTHGNHKLEIVWTIIPAIILAIIAFIQFGLWTDLKDPQKFAALEDENALTVHVLGKQFNWAFRYPGPDNQFGTADDFTDAALWVPAERDVIIRMKSIDVIHSFYVPVLRFKQDLLPGTIMTGWFNARYVPEHRKPDAPEGQIDYPIVCAELCGIQHYTMAGQLHVIEPSKWDALNAKMSKELAPIDYQSEVEFFRFWPIEKK